MRRPPVTVTRPSSSDVGQAPRAATTGDQAAKAGDGNPAQVASHTAQSAELGVLSLHFEGGRCRVNCPFCYLGKRAGTPNVGFDEELVGAAIAELPYREVAVALSEPIEPVLPLLERLADIANRRGKPIALTTTMAVAMALPAAILGRIQRINLSVDPFKGQLDGPAGQVAPDEVATVLKAVRGRAQLEHVLIVTLSTPRFAEQLWDGRLAELLALPEVDRVALNALKPPPPWCDRKFWLRALQRIGPILREHLDRRLFLDCYVAARILNIGGCPARPDLSPASTEESGYLQLGRSAVARGAVAFRSCVYQPAADFVVRDAHDLQNRLRDFTPPQVCPFPIH